MPIAAAFSPHDEQRALPSVMAAHVQLLIEFHHVRPLIRNVDSRL
jgi:hypothetical protein